MISYHFSSYKNNIRRKSISKRLRNLGLTEVRTYTLVPEEMTKLFKYENKENAGLPNPMSLDKAFIRNTILPSLLNTYDYNKARHVKDILIYEIAKTYDKNFNEDLKVAMLIKGNYISNDWMHNTIKCDFYTLKGIVENLLEYLGFKNRYSFEVVEVESLHPGQSANLLVDRETIGIIGRINPSVKKEDIYVCELSISKLYEKSTKPLKYKEANKFPKIVKDLAFVVNKDISSDEIVNIIKRSGGRLLTNVEVFDVYTGENINSDKKSIAYTLDFEDQTRTLTEEEVMNVFNKIINDVESKIDAKVRDK